MPREVPPVGDVAVPSPNFTKQNHIVSNIDFNQSTNTQHRFRFTLTNTADIDTDANLPAFFAAQRGGFALAALLLVNTFVSLFAGFLPVPGGVGPMTIAMLMSNTVKAARQSL